MGRKRLSGNVPRVSIVVGTRPEIVKMASILRRLSTMGSGLDWELVHTEQHYDEGMSEVFFRDLDLPAPTVRLAVGSGTQAAQVAAMLVRLEERYRKSRPDAVIVQGDTNTVLAGALVAAKMRIPVAHVEAGLRSYDNRMPEEHNRRVTDHLSDFLYAPTPRAEATLRSESVWGEVAVVGNTAIDACALLEGRAAELGRRVEVPFGRFALATAHRAENVDDDKVLAGFARVFAESPLPVVWPVHPRARARLVALGLDRKLEASGNVHLLAPLGYIEFLDLMRRSSLVLTDSGGIQEEATAPNVRKRVLVLRTTTERPEAAEAGFARVVGVDPEQVLTEVHGHVAAGCPSPSGASPFGDGHAGERILAHLAEKLRA